MVGTAPTYLARCATAEADEHRRRITSPEQSVRSADNGRVSQSPGEVDLLSVFWAVAYGSRRRACAGVVDGRTG